MFSRARASGEALPADCLVWIRGLRSACCGFTSGLLRCFCTRSVKQGTGLSCKAILRGCRDLSDNMFLEAAVRGNARCLVSRDDDLKRDLELVGQREGRGIQVVSVQQFLDILSGSADG